MAIQSCAVYVVLLQQKEVPGSAAADGPHSPDASRAYGPILIRSGPPMVPLHVAAGVAVQCWYCFEVLAITAPCSIRSTRVPVPPRKAFLNLV